MNWYATATVFQVVCLVGILLTLPVMWAIATGRLDDHLYDITGIWFVGAGVGLLVIAAVAGVVAGMAAV